MGKLCLVRIPARIKDDPDPTKPRVLVKASKLTIVSSCSFRILPHLTPAAAIITLSKEGALGSLAYVSIRQQLAYGR